MKISSHKIKFEAFPEAFFDNFGPKLGAGGKMYCGPKILGTALSSRLSETPSGNYVLILSSPTYDLGTTVTSMS